MVNMYYLLGASLQFRPYFEWVPSEANIADLPSRGRFDEMLAITPARRIEFIYPPLGCRLRPRGGFCPQHRASLAIATRNSHCRTWVV